MLIFDFRFYMEKRIQKLEANVAKLLEFWQKRDDDKHDTSTEEEDSSDSDDDQLPECRTELVSTDDDDDYQLPACSAELASTDDDEDDDSSSTESTHEADAEVARVFSRGRPLQPTMTKKRPMRKAATDRAISKKIARF